MELDLTDRRVQILGYGYLTLKLVAEETRALIETMKANDLIFDDYDILKLTHMMKDHLFRAEIIDAELRKIGDIGEQSIDEYLAELKYITNPLRG